MDREREIDIRNGLMGNKLEETTFLGKEIAGKVRKESCGLGHNVWGKNHCMHAPRMACRPGLQNSKIDACTKFDLYNAK